MKGFHERPARKTFPEAMPQTSVSRGRASVRNIRITYWKHLSENTCRKTLVGKHLGRNGWKHPATNRSTSPHRRMHRALRRPAAGANGKFDQRNGGSRRVYHKPPKSSPPRGRSQDTASGRRSLHDDRVAPARFIE